MSDVLSPAPPAPETPAGTAKALEARLRAIMHSWQLPIDPAAEETLSELIQQAAQRVEAEGFAADLSKLWEVETNFRRLLTEMTRQAGALGLYQLDASAYVDAMARLCPIWPFC